MSMRASVALALLGIALITAMPTRSVAACMPAAPGARQSTDIAITFQPVDIRGAEYFGTRLAGAYVLGSDHNGFGGLSGMLIENGGSRFVAATDRARWIAGTLVRDGQGRISGFTAGRTQRMRGRRGRLDGSQQDAEALTRLGDAILVGFERDQRIMRCAADSRLAAYVELDEWDDLPRNGGLEALATMPDGRLIAIAETPVRGAGFPYWVFVPEGETARLVATGFLPQGDRHHITAADYGPDGNLYVLERDYSQLRGVSIRLVRYWPDPSPYGEGLPLARTAEVLARFNSITGIDNMEAISVWEEPGGRLMVTLLSDDNFNALQRNLLVELEILR